MNGRFDDIYKKFNVNAGDTLGEETRNATGFRTESRFSDIYKQIGITPTTELEIEETPVVDTLKTSTGVPLMRPSIAVMGQTGTPTKLETTRAQNIAELQAITEVNRGIIRAKMLGKEDELQDYLKKAGRTDGLSEIDYYGENALNIVFDALSAGNYASAAFVDELLNSGSTSAAFRRAARDFGNAIGVDDEKAQKLTFNDVFNNQGYDFFGSSVAAFALDLVLDPTNLIPGTAIAKAVGKGGRAAVKAAGPAGEVFNKAFRYGASFEDLKKQGVDILADTGMAEAGIKKEQQEVIQRVDRITANMNPAERLLFGLYMDQPERLVNEAKRMAKQGIIAEDRAKVVEETAKTIKDYTDEMFKRERKWGLIDDAVYRDNYIYGIEAVDPSTGRAFDDFMFKRGNTLSMPGPKEKAPFAQRRRTKNQEERVKLILDGKIGAKSTELDIANILLKRGFDHTRFIASKKFTDGILNSTAKTADGVPVSTRIDPKIARNDAKLKAEKERIQAENPNMAVFEVKRKVKDKDGDVLNVVDSAYIMPKEVVDHMTRTDAAFKGTEEMTKLHRVYNDLMNVWRGWTTFSPGYHFRNYLGMLGTNWIRGVGAKEVDLSKLGLGDAVNFKLPVGTGFAKRHLQAMKAQVATDGAGRLPMWMAKGANAMAKSAGYKNFADVPMDIVVDGKKLTAKELAELAERYDVPQMIGHMGPTGENINHFIWRDMTPTVGIDESKLDNIDPLLRDAMQIYGNKKKSIAQRAGELVGGNSPLLQLNRAAATIPENNGRMALFIDRLVKGDSPAEAALETKKWHFDYRLLTPFEKKWMAGIIPFYAWSRFAVPRMFMAALEDPGRLAKVPKAQRAIEQEAIEKTGYDYETPDYYDELQAVQLPFMDKDGYPVYASLDMPWMELQRLNSKDVLSGLNPLIKIPFELAGGQKFFTDTPIERFRGEEDPVVELFPGTGIPIGKGTRNVIGNIAPAYERFFLRPQEMYDRDQTMYSLIKELGVNARPLDVRRTMRGKTFENRKLIREFFQRIEQEND